MNYILIDNQKYELVGEPKYFYNENVCDININSNNLYHRTQSVWKFKIKSKFPIKFIYSTNEIFLKIDDIKKAKFIYKGTRVLSNCKEYKIYQITCGDFKYLEISKEDRRDFIINELSD